MDADNNTNDVSETENDSTFDFTKKTWKEDVTLVVEGKRLYAAKNILAFVSPVFEAMFSTPFSEKDKEEIELPGKEYDSFLEFLLCVYPNSEKYITAENIFKLLPLADEYQVKLLKKRCETYLLQHMEEPTNTTQSLFTCLAVLERYRMDKIKAICVGKIMEREPLEVINIKLDPVYKDTMLEILKELVTKQNKQIETINTKLVKLYMHTGLDLDIDDGEYAGFKNAKGAMIEFTVTNVSALIEQRSTILTVWGFTFNALVKFTSRDGGSNMGIFLQVNPPHNVPLWTCGVKAQLILKNRGTEENKKNISMQIDHVFTKDKDDWGYKCGFGTMKDLLNPNLGFIKDNKVEIVIFFLVKEPVCTC